MFLLESDSAVKLISDLQAKGVVLWRKGESIRFRGPTGLLTPEALRILKAKKPEILPLLTDEADAAAIEVDRTPNIACLGSGSTSQRVFCVHAIDGDVASYIDLAQELALRGASTYGVFALDFRQRGSIPNSIEAIAAKYVEQLQRIQKNGPYSLVGWSSGGLIALEIARQLACTENEFPEVTLMDTNPFPARAAQPVELPPGHRDLPLSMAQLESAKSWWRFVKLNVADADEHGRYRISENFWTMDDADKSRYLFDNRHNPQILKPENGQRAAGDADDVLYMFHTMNILFEALKAYKLSIYPGRINLFVAIDAEAPEEQSADGSPRDVKAIFEKIVGKVAHSEWVTGGHLEIIRRPFVANVARAILR